MFGSWCPNCHDAAEYLVELDRRYRSRGLSILGLAFEFDNILHPDGDAGPAPSEKEALMKILETSGKTFNEEIVKALIAAFKSGVLKSEDDDFFEEAAS